MTLGSGCAEQPGEAGAPVGEIGNVRDIQAALKEDRQEPIPLSCAQERLWFLSRLGITGPAYNVCWATRLSGPLDTDALARSCHMLKRRHTSLHTRFLWVDDKCTQVVDPAAKIAIETINYSVGDDLSESAKKFVERRFDLGTGPLFRVGLIQVGAYEHVLVMVVHHIVSDGWSMGVLTRELSMLYTAFRAGLPSPLPDPLLQYADYALWQRNLLQGEALKGQLDYWLGQLRDAPATLELPTDRPRPPVASFKGGYSKAALAADVSAALSAFAKRERVTLYMVVLAAFQLVLSRWSGQSEVVVGSPISGRHRPELEQLVGCFLNVLAMRVDLSGNPSFRDLLRRVRTTTLDAYGHQDLPFEKLVEALHPVRDLSRQPVFQVALAMNVGEDAPLGFDGLEATSINIEHSAAHFDLLLTFTEAASGHILGLEYASDLFDRSTIERLSGHLCRVFSAVVADPDVRLSAVAMLDDAERHRLLVEWNETARAVPWRPVQAAIGAQARARPDAPALVFGARETSYAALEAASDRLAQVLRRQGVGPDVIVGLCLERSVALVVGLLGILKAGGAYLPLDPNQPPERLASLLEGLPVRLVLTRASPDRPDAGPDFERDVGRDFGDIPILALDSDGQPAGWPSTAGQPCEPAHLAPENLAYVIHTSGSTGRPKAVMVSHAALSNHMAWMQAAFPLGPGDAVLQKTPLGFDASIWEVLAPLLAGARLVLAPPGAEREPAALLAAVAAHGITRLQVVPSLLQALLESPAFARCTTLTDLFCGGEALSASLRDRLRQHLPVRLHNLYGPSETCIQTVVHSCAEDDAEIGGLPIPIGRPIWNTVLHVLDGALSLVPVGVAGELYIGGAALARGYAGRPADTALRFIANPFGQSARLYRTGDRVRRRTDGRLEFLGRADTVRLDTLPRPTSEEIDRKNPPDSDLTRPTAPPSNVVEPVPTPLEIALNRIWQSVLEVDDVGPDDNFFDLGGHSLLAMLLIARIGESVDLELSPQLIFEAPTFRELSARVELAVWANSPSPQTDDNSEVEIVF